MLLFEGNEVGSCACQPKVFPSFPMLVVKAKRKIPSNGYGRKEMVSFTLGASESSSKKIKPR